MGDILTMCLCAKFYLGDIAQVDGRAIAQADDQIADRFRIGQEGTRLYQNLLVVVHKAAGIGAGIGTV